ncbi:MAG: glycosyltransferase family 4 protein [Bacteroidota bacterium]
MKILQLCKKLPYPLKDGESIAVTHLSKALRDLSCEVTLLSMNTTKHFFDLKHLPKSYDHYKAIHTVKVDNRIRPWGAFLNLFSSASYHVSRFITTEFEQKLIQLLQAEDYDIIQLETVYLAPYIPVIRANSKAAVVMRAHNVEHEIWERVANNSHFLKRIYLNYLTAQLKRYEIEQLQNYDLLVAITKRDMDIFHQFGYQKGAIVIPVGMEPRNYRPNYESYQSAPSISFIGALDWMPNQDGLKWFLNAVWPKLHEAHPTLKLHIAGRHTPKDILHLAMSNVTIHGEVPDAKEFINAHSIMIVPLLSGSGIRVKILEGMALGKVVITTSVGMEGIDAQNDKEVLVADSATAFVDSISTCVNHQQRLEKIGRQARHLIVSEFDNVTIAARLVAQYQQLMQQNNTQMPVAISKPLG